MVFNQFKNGSTLFITVQLIISSLISTSAVFADATKADAKLSRYQSRIVNQLKKCDDASQPEALSESQFFKIANKKYVVQVMCYLGAYQGRYEYYLLTENSGRVQSKPLSLLKINEDAGRRIRTQDNAIVGLPTFNAATKELVVFNKYRGIGDCGTFGKYKFENDRFVAKELRAKFDCDGNFIEPERYQKIYP